MAAESHGEKKDYLSFFTLQMGLIYFLLIQVDPSPILFYFCFFLFDPSWSESMRVDPTRTGCPSWSGPTFVPAY